MPTLAGCKQAYSPNAYAASAAQQEAAVQRGEIVGVRQVLITTNGAVGAATGGAVGGLAGAQVPGGSVGTALGAIGGTLVGGLGGAAAAQAVGDTKGWEYIVQETGDKLVSVTQTSKTPLPVGLHVLVIADAQQARIVPDYTVQSTPPPAAKPAAAPGAAAPPEVNVSPLLPDTGDLAPLQLAPINMGSDATAQPSPATSSPTPAPDAAAAPASAASNTNPPTPTPTPTPSTAPSAAAAQPAAGSTAPATSSPAASPLPAAQKEPN